MIVAGVVRTADLVLESQDDFRGVGNSQGFHGPCIHAQILKTLCLAAKIRKEDKFISPADALIVASFLEDPQSDILYTTDGAIIRSRTIDELAKERGKNIHELA